MAFTAATDKRVAALIAPGLEEVEALAVVDVLYRAGIPCDMIAVAEERTVVSSHEIVLTCAKTLAETDLDDYDLLFLPGGIPGALNLKASRVVTEAVTERVRAGRPVAAICAAPSILAELGLLDGRRATSNPGFMQVLEEHGAITSQDSVVVDGAILTSRGMATAAELGFEIVRHYLGDAAAEAVAGAVVFQR